MSEGEIEKQLLDEIAKVSISSSFVDWVIRSLDQAGSEIRASQQKAIEQRNREKNAIEKQLDALIDMRANGELSADEFRKKKTRLSRNLAHMDVMESNGHGIERDWASIAKEKLLKLENVLERFKQSDNDKKQILASLGWNLSLKDKNLCITWPNWISPIMTAAKALKPLETRLEPPKAIEKQRYFDDLYGRNKALWACRDQVRTELIKDITSVTSLNSSGRRLRD